MTDDCRGNLFYFIKIFLLFFSVMTGFHGRAQSVAGITHVPDTSYTTWSAYISTRKTHPDIKIVQEFRSKTVAEKRNIPYCAIGERTLLLDAFYPARQSRKKRTAIIIIHGGGWRSGNRTQHYPLAQRLANLGYVCFTPEYRLSTEALYPAAVYDLKSALKWVYNHAAPYNIDTSKITVLGFSAGGELAAFLGTTIGDAAFDNNACNGKQAVPIHAVVDLDGTLSFTHSESGEGDDSKRTSAATYWFGYSKKDNPALWEHASPLAHVGPHTPPTLFINSSVDRMHAGRSDYIKVLDQYHIYSQVRTFEGAPHSFCLFDPWFEPTVKYIDDFLKSI
jgi:pectinesterase